MLAGRRRWVKEEFTERATHCVIYIFVPALVFSALNQLSYSLRDAMSAFLSGTAVVLIVGTAVTLLSAVKGFDRRRVFLPVTFMNTANLGYPLTLALFGLDALPLAVSFSVAVTMLHFTYGVYNVSESEHFKGKLLDVFRLPLVYAFVAGILMKGVHLPWPIRWTFNLAGAPMVPVMLFLLGFDITRIPLKRQLFWKTFYGLLVRMGGGLLIGALISYLFHFPDKTSGVVILLSSMPPAVMSYLLAKKFKAEPEFAAAMVLVGTLLCPFFVAGFYFFGNYS